MGQYANLGEPDYIDDNGFDTRYSARPGKILYGMNMAFNASLRSKDPSTKCGCFFTDEDGGSLVTGYNSPLRGVKCSKVPMDRPRKYYHFEHSERNAIYQSSKRGISLDKSIVYVNGFPCIDCSRGMIHSGVTEIYYGPCTPKMCADEELYKEYEIIFSGETCKLIKFRYLQGLIDLNPNFKDRVEGQLPMEWEFNV